MSIIGNLGVALYDLAEDQASWSQAAFGSDAERGPIGALKHLAKEAHEAEEAALAVRTLKEMNTEPCATLGQLHEELADCLLLILDASRRSGMTPLQLIQAAQAKMLVNKLRAWPKPQDDTPVEHVREYIGGHSDKTD
jgi:NTP pyrophosphatase (non-canonical NTP hydrolase)